MVGRRVLDEVDAVDGGGNQNMKKKKTLTSRTARFPTNIPGAVTAPLFTASTRQCKAAVHNTSTSDGSPSGHRSTLLLASIPTS